MQSQLTEFLSEIEGYTTLRNIRLNDHAYKLLNLDDYYFADYLDADRGKVNLYVGYYYLANKAYASHSPTICYPSQGWEVINKPTRDSLNAGIHTIEYEEIVTAYGDVRELVLYWYQAGTKTNTQVYKNKIDMGWNKLVHNDEQHGFVRVSIPFSNSTYEETKDMALKFIKSFYPHFIEFVMTSPSRKSHLVAN